MYHVSCVSCVALLHSCRNFISIALVHGQCILPLILRQAYLHIIYDAVTNKRKLYSGKFQSTTREFSFLINILKNEVASGIMYPCTYK